MISPKGLPYQIYPDRTNLFLPIKLSSFCSKINKNITEVSAVSYMNMSMHKFNPKLQRHIWRECLGAKYSWDLLESQIQSQERLDRTDCIRTELSIH